MIPSGDEFTQLVRAYHRTRAEWFSKVYAIEEHPDDVTQPLCAAHTVALDRLLLTPAPDLAALATKIEIFNAEEIEDGWHSNREIVSVLATDAKRLCAHS